MHSVIWGSPREVKTLWRVHSQPPRSRALLLLCHLELNARRPDIKENVLALERFPVTGLVTSRVVDVSLTNSEMTCAPSVMFGVTRATARPQCLRSWGRRPPWGGLSGCGQHRAVLGGCQPYPPGCWGRANTPGQLVGARSFCQCSVTLQRCELGASGDSHSTVTLDTYKWHLAPRSDMWSHTRGLCKLFWK